MNSVLVSAWAMFLLGLLHGLGPDHLAAVTALAGKDLTAGLRRAAGFALGHCLTLALVGVVAEPFLGAVPESWDRWAELLGGALLAGIGAFSLAGSLGWHLHRHEHGDGKLHRHFHGHPSPHQHAHNASGLHWFGSLGALAALSGIRAVSMRLSEAAPAGTALAAIAFGLGILLSMGGAALLTASIPRRFPGASVVVHRSTAAVALCVGMGWTAVHW